MLLQLSSERYLFLLGVAVAASATVATAFVIHRPSVLNSFKTTRTTTSFLNNGFFKLSATGGGGGAMKELPKDVVKYSQVPKGPGKTFTATTIPKGLLKEHNTKVGTWGVIRVQKGKLQYQINNNSSEPPLTIELDNKTPGIIEPQIRHQVAPLTDDVEFVVEFWRLPKTGPVDEPREGL